MKGQDNDISFQKDSQLSEFPPNFLQATSTFTFNTTQCPDYVCDAILWSPQCEIRDLHESKNSVLHKTTNSQIIKDKVHNAKDTLFDNYHDKTTNIKEKQILMNVISNTKESIKTSNIKGKFPFVKSSNFYLGKSLNFPYSSFKFPFVKSSNFSLGKFAVACRLPIRSKIPMFTQEPCYNMYNIFGKKEITYINGKQISKTKQNYSNSIYSVHSHSNIKANHLQLVALNYFARQNVSETPKFSPAKSVENRPCSTLSDPPDVSLAAARGSTKWPPPTLSDPAAMNLAAASGLIKWPPCRRLQIQIPINLLIIKGTLKNPGINFHENLKKIVKIKVYIFLFLGSPSIILARSDPLLYM